MIILLLHYGFCFCHFYLSRLLRTPKKNRLGLNLSGFFMGLSMLEQKPIGLQLKLNHEELF